MSVVRLSPEAVDELVEAAAWYRGQRPGLESEFLAEVDRVLPLIGGSPASFPRLLDAPEDLAPTRAAPALSLCRDLHGPRDGGRDSRRGPRKATGPATGSIASRKAVECFPGRNPQRGSALSREAGGSGTHTRRQAPHGTGRRTVRERPRATLDKTWRIPTGHRAGRLGSRDPSRAQPNVALSTAWPRSSYSGRTINNSGRR